MDVSKVMDTKFNDNDLGETTIREYLKELLAQLLAEGEGFSGKRPFGNSGWEKFAAPVLIRANLLEGELDDEGYPDHFDNAEYDKLLQECVEIL